jgi:TRAP-type uncharacterized transport system fused permease subunit
MLTYLKIAAGCLLAYIIVVYFYEAPAIRIEKFRGIRFLDALLCIASLAVLVYCAFQSPKTLWHYLAMGVSGLSLFGVFHYYNGLG